MNAQLLCSLSPLFLAGGHFNLMAGHSLTSQFPGVIWFLPVIFFSLFQLTTCVIINGNSTKLWSLLPRHSSPAGRGTVISLVQISWHFLASKDSNYRFIFRKEQREGHSLPGSPLPPPFLFLQRKPIWAKFLCEASSSLQLQKYQEDLDVACAIKYCLCLKQIMKCEAPAQITFISHIIFPVLKSGVEGTLEPKDALTVPSLISIQCQRREKGGLVLAEPMKMRQFVGLTV